jgi:hypothetical protein
LTPDRQRVILNKLRICDSASDDDRDWPEERNVLSRDNPVAVVVRQGQ